MSPAGRASSWDHGPRRRLLLLITGALGVLIAWEFIDLWHAYDSNGDVAQDWLFYVEIGRRWLDTGILYGDRQLSGLPYHVLVNVDNLYPPPAIVLFAPFAMVPRVISAILWWGLPIAVVVVVVARLRPSIRTWPLMALCIFWPRTLGSLIAGNSDLLMAAFVAGGIAWGWPGALGFFKLSLAPFALAGAGRRSWWIGLAAVVAVSIPFLFSGAWSQYVTVATQWDLPVTRQVANVPILLIPVVAWLGRREPSLSSTRSGEGAT